MAGGVRIDLRGGQRRRYLFGSYLSAGGMAVGAMLMWMMGAPFVVVGPPALIFSTLIIGCYARVAFGWVRAERAGLRTSRILRGRFLRWDEIDSIERKTRYGRGSRVTLAVVRTYSGRRYSLPVPRTTERSVDRVFERDLRYLMSRASAARDTKAGR